MQIPHQERCIAKDDLMFRFGQSYRCVVFVHPRQKWYINYCGTEYVELSRNGVQIQMSYDEFCKHFEQLKEQKK